MYFSATSPADFLPRFKKKSVFTLGVLLAVRVGFYFKTVVRVLFILKTVRREDRPEKKELQIKNLKNSGRYLALSPTSPFFRDDLPSFLIYCLIYFAIK